MNEGVRYLTLPEVQGQHAMIMRASGQQGRLMDEGKLDAALMRPQQAAHYEDAGLTRQAALLLAGIAQARAYSDGNKRLALVASASFLRLNGYGVVAEQDQFAQAVIDFVLRHEGDPTGAVNVLTSWLERRVRSLGVRGESACTPVPTLSIEATLPRRAGTSGKGRRC